MDYTQNNIITQLQLSLSTNFLQIPSSLDGFTNTHTTTGTTFSDRDIFCFHGDLDVNATDCICPKCTSKVHINCNRNTTLRHLCFGHTLTCVSFGRKQFYCPICGHSYMQDIPFKAENHRITLELEQYTKDLLATSNYTLKEVAEITGLGKNTVKTIDKRRLQENYTVDGKVLRKPEKQAKYLGIDEFKLHDGHKYATHIIDMNTGHILWIAHGKKKQVVYDFIEHVGLEWIDEVEAIACDMNSDFEEAFEEKCPHIQPVFDYFHIVKNFNDKVVGAVRKDEQRRLISEGNEEAAKALKKTRFILTSKKSTLEKKDQEVTEGKILSKESELFNIPEYKREGNYLARYEELIKENELLLTVDIVKEKLTVAYQDNDESKMSKEIIEIIDICDATENKHFKWFSRLLTNYFEGIIAHGTYKISAGKIEGINNKIKTIRRQGYGYPDDEYFFLKLIDMSRTTYVRNVKSHKLCD